MNVVRLSDGVVDLCSFRNDEDAIKLYHKWSNDSSICAWVGNHRYVATLDDTRHWADSIGSHECRFGIVVNDVLIGHCKVVYTSITAYIDICIGESEYRSKGYGSRTLKQLIKFSFDQLNVNRIELSVNSKNTNAINCYKKVGFKECGALHEAEYFDGNYCDIIMMEILRKDFKDEISH